MQANQNPWSNFVNTLRLRMNTDWDNMVGIQGERGSGKSTLALRIALSVDEGFPANHVFYDPQDWSAVVHPKAKKQVYILDEGTNLAFNRTWQNRQQITLMKLLNTIRQRNHTLIWCAPNLERMDVVVRGDIIKYRFSTMRRGLAVLHERRYNWENGTASWLRKSRIHYGSLKWHPIWNEYEARKRQSFNQNKFNQTNAKEDTEPSNQRNPDPYEDLIREP